jgi:hypothetical protein
MALQWMLLGVVVGAEVVILLLLTAPLPRPLAQKVVDFVRKILQPGLAIVPFAIFQLLGQFPTTSFNPNFCALNCMGSVWQLHCSSEFLGMVITALSVGNMIMQRYTGSMNIASLVPRMYAPHWREIAFKDL